MPMWSSIKHFYCLLFSSIDNSFLIQLDFLDVVLSLKFILKCFMMHLGQAKHAFENLY